MGTEAVAAASLVVLAVLLGGCGRVDAAGGLTSDGSGGAGAIDATLERPISHDGGRRPVEGGGGGAAGAGGRDAADAGQLPPADAAEGEGGLGVDTTALVIDAGGPCDCRDVEAWRVTLGGGADLVGSAGSAALAEAYPLNVHCAEDQPLLTIDACAEVVRLSACRGPGGEPPCLYLARLPDRFLLGHVLDATGKRWDALDGTFTLGPIERVSRSGRYTATLAVPEGGTRSISGDFTVCARTIRCPL